MNRKIIFLDIDGTLSYDNRVPESAKRACKAARRNGHILYICTGRARIQISTAIVRIGFDGIVSSGGAYIETALNTQVPFNAKRPAPVISEIGGKVLFEAAIEREKLRALTAYLNGRHAAYMLELTDRLIAGPYLRSYAERYIRPQPFTLGRLREWRLLRQAVFAECDWDSGDLNRADVRKVTFWDSGGVTFEDVEREFGGSFDIARLSIPLPDMTGGEIGPLGIHKGFALEKVSWYHGVDLADTIAYGDSDNDRAMIQRAGLGVAMGNAEPSLKAIAGDVADSVKNNGLAESFKKYGLI